MRLTNALTDTADHFRNRADAELAAGDEAAAEHFAEAALIWETQAAAAAKELTMRGEYPFEVEMDDDEAEAIEDAIAEAEDDDEEDDDEEDDE